MSRRTDSALLLWLVSSCSAQPAGRVDAGATDRILPPDPRAAVCDDAGADSITFARVQQIFDFNCLSCHGYGGPLNLVAGQSWKDLVGQPAPSPDSCGGTLVAPGDPAGSYLYEKLASSAPCYGAQMPLGEFFANPLPSCVVGIVGQWIQEGAPSSNEADAAADGSP